MTCSQPGGVQRATGKPWSFLHVSKAEIDLDPATDPYDRAVYAKAAANLARMVEAGVLIRDPRPCYYVYRMIWRGRVEDRCSPRSLRSPTTPATASASMSTRRRPRKTTASARSRAVNAQDRAGHARLSQRAGARRRARGEPPPAMPDGRRHGRRRRAPPSSGSIADDGQNPNASPARSTPCPRSMSPTATTAPRRRHGSQRAFRLSGNRSAARKARQL